MSGPSELKGQGGGDLPPYFGRYINPIEIRDGLTWGGDNAHHIFLEKT